MHFADQRGVVSCGAEMVREGLMPRLVGMCIVLSFVMMTVQAGHQRSSRRRAYRIGTICIRKSNALFCKRIKVRSTSYCVAIGSHAAALMLVRHDEKHVWLRLLRLRQSGLSDQS